MNNKRSPIEQFLLIALLTFSAFTLYNSFFGQKNNPSTPARTAPTLGKAFEGLDSERGKAPTEKAASAEIAELQKKIEASPKDDYAMWAHLRVGLLQQYVLRNAIQARESFDFVINRHKNEPIDAQALYQKGDLQWRQAEYSKKQPGSAAGSTPVGGDTRLDATQIKQLEADAAYALEQIPTRARGDRSFLERQIYVPNVASYRNDPLDLPIKWEQASLNSLRGELNSSDPRGILSRVDLHYSRTPAFGIFDLYGLFDTVVKWCGAQPTYSYGFALIILAFVTRTVMQPLIKKQYDSMKGMSIIAPEMKKIQDKYKGKTDQAAQVKMMQEIRALQKEHGVNPMGCGISMLIQMPVFFFFVLPLINHYQAHLELAGASFGWIRSLARPDIPLLVLYAISMFISVRLSSTPPADDQQRQMQKITTLMSPLFALVLWSYPSAFILYWFTYNVLSMIFQWRMIKKSEPQKDLVKTLMGTNPAPALADGSTPDSNGALPPRPGGEKNGSEKNGRVKAVQNQLDNQMPFETSADVLNATPPNGISKNGAAKNGATKSDAVSTSGSQRARRRRR